MIQDRIVRLDGKVPSIFFPSGAVDDGGTCQFATKRCLDNCYAEDNEVIDNVYKFITIEDTLVVCKKIYDDLKSLNCFLLQWFAGGDCETKYEKKILQIISYLSYKAVIQCGFTRNRSLWNAANNINGINLVLTLEYKKYANSRKIYSGLIGVPDYDKSYVNIYKCSESYRTIEHVGCCGGNWSQLVTNKNKFKKITIENNCSYCYKKKLGCFYIP